MDIKNELFTFSDDYMCRICESETNNLLNIYNSSNEEILQNLKQIGIQIEVIFFEVMCEKKKNKNFISF